MTARSDRDLTPETIVQKVSDASGSRYSAGNSTAITSGPSPLVSSKPAFNPTRSSANVGGFNPLASKPRANIPKDATVDEDGWGHDAPPVTRTQLEKVPSSYEPTKVNMRELSSQNQEPTRFNGTWSDNSAERSDVVKGGYQPIGKVDITALRRQAQESSTTHDDRPSVVKGSYEPVGKVDLAAIRARAQGPSEGATSSPTSVSPAATGNFARSNDYGDKTNAETIRSTPFPSSERLTTLPKPKIANRFGSNVGTFTGTKASSPSGFGHESKASPSSPPVGVGRTFADQGGKTPAQIWAEKKARERGLSGASENPPSAGFGGLTSPLVGQTSGGGEWKSSYGGKSWAPVQTTKTGHSQGSLGQQHTGEEQQEQQEAPISPTGGVGAIRDRFKNTPPMGTAATGPREPPSPPAIDNSQKPNAGQGMPIPGLPTRPIQQDTEPEEEEGEAAPRMPSPPPQPPRSPTPPTPPVMRLESPIRVAMPVGRGHDSEVEDAREEQFSPPPSMPSRSLAQAIPHEDDLTDEPVGRDPARGAGMATAANSFGQQRAEEPIPPPTAHEGGKRALVQYDYEKAEDNELELKEGDYVTHIDMVDEDWWMGQNTRGETGLFPSNYVELVADDESEHAQHAMSHESVAESTPSVGPAPGALGAGEAAEQGAVATAIYDYEAAEDNELSFPEGAKIVGVVSSSRYSNPALILGTVSLTRYQ